MKTQSLLTKDKPEMLSKNVKEKDKGIQIMIENTRNISQGPRRTKEQTKSDEQHNK